jgi:protein-tyrosine phosphatase
VTPTGCIGPGATRGSSCAGSREPGSLFCREHEAAPATKRGGWISADKRRRARSANVTHADLDCSNVARRLWVGARPPVDRHLPEFDVLVLCAQEIQPQVLAFRGTVLRCPLPDSELTSTQTRTALAGGRAVARHLHEGRTVLVTCAKGINRSALIASLALGLVTYMSADQIFLLMRAQRHADCLHNSSFRGILQRYIADGRRPSKKS